MKRFCWLAVAACMIALSLGHTVAQAGDWSIGIGLGGYPGHCHHHGYYSPYWYPPPPRYVYVAPPPVTYVQPAPVQYVVPPPAPLAQTTVSSPLAVRPNSMPAYQGRGVTIQNPKATGASVAFVVDEQSELMLGPGQTKALNDKGTYVVEFDRGGEYGTSRKTLTEGPWKFVATPSGWDLQRDFGDASSDDVRPVVRRNSLPTVR